MSNLCSNEIILQGPTTNLGFLGAVIDSEAFEKGNTLTNFLDTTFSYKPSGIDVVAAGSFSTIQDFPARPSIGYGVPKSGPMDSLSSRIANLLVGNPRGTEVIEATLLGPELLFTAASVVSVCGATAPVTINGAERLMWSTLAIEAGQVLKVGAVSGSGCRIYIAVRGGFPGIPLVLGSKATTPSLKFGGCQGRALRNGDFLAIAKDTSEEAAAVREFSLPSSLVPIMDVKYIHALQGPHDSDDIMTAEDRAMLYTAPWKVGHNSSRTGIRLVGPAPKWARNDGGEAGSHPSNYLE